MVERARKMCCLALALAACSGGGGSGSQTPPPPINRAPVVTIAGPSSVNEADIFSLMADASDVDGLVDGIVWTQTAGPTAVMSGDLSAELTIQAPLVLDQQTATFQVVVTDNDGAATTQTVNVDFNPVAGLSRLILQFTFDAEVRTYTVYTPDSYQPGNPAVLLLHGGGGSMREILNPGRATERWLEIADRDGTLIIIPNGFSNVEEDGLGDQQSWNDIRMDSTGRISLEDDVGFLLNVLDQVQEGRAFDEDRLLSTGSSNGGMMTFRMLIEHGERFIGGAAFIGAMPEAMVPLPNVARPMFLFNGDEDPLILFDGGVVGQSGAPTRSIPDTIEYWLEATLADRTTETSAQLPDKTNDDCLIDVTTWTTGTGAPALTAYIARGGGHTIPDTEPIVRTPAAEALLGNQCSDVHGIDLVDDFFKALR